MQPALPRRRPARPVPEAPIEALVADAERLAKGWLIAVIEQRPLAEAGGLASREWATEAPRVCAAAVRALASDRELAELVPPAGLGGSLDALRAVLWSALRSAWPGCEPDQVWDLGERLAAVIESLADARAPWPHALEEAVAAEQGLALVLAELVDYDRLLATESPEDCAKVVSRFRDAVRAGIGDAGGTVADGEARVWAIAPRADRERGLALGAAVADAVRAAPPWRGAPMLAAVGIAVLGDDGRDARSLIEAAEEQMFASAAGGSR